MRIHLSLNPSQFDTPVASSSSSSSPLIQLGGDLVLVELQGELSYEGEKSNGVVGVIGLDRPDKPTLHLGPHHLLHGKFVNLQKPYAVIRKAVGDQSTNPNTQEGKGGNTTILEGDAQVEEDEEEDSSSSEEEEEDLFKNDNEPMTPNKNGKGKEKDVMYSSSPIYQTPLIPMDYSSELDMSSPARSELDDFDSDLYNKRRRQGRGFPSDKDEEAEEEEDDRPNKRSKNGSNTNNNSKKGLSKKVQRRKEKERQSKTGETVKNNRVRSYQVVGIVKKKIVFALRPEPLVAPTILPE